MANAIDEILSQLPAEELAAQLGTDPDTAMDAARKALPALLGGLNREVGMGQGDALGAALQRDHDGSLLDSPNPLAAVDMADGQKILGHIFGDQTTEVEQRLGAKSAAGSSIFSKLLPMLAPLVMAWLGKRMGGALGGGGATTQSDVTEGGGLGDILGGGGLGGLLGGLLGGEVDSTKSSAPDLGGLFDILGGSDGQSGRGEDVPDVGDIFGR